MILRKHSLSCPECGIHDLEPLGEGPPGITRLRCPYCGYLGEVHPNECPRGPSTAEIPEAELERESKPRERPD